MGKTERQLPDLLDKLRWIIPALMAAGGIGYILSEHFPITYKPSSPADILRQAIIISAVGTMLAWVLLTWAVNISRSRQEAITSLKRRALQLEIASQVSQKVTAILEINELLPEVVRLIQDRFGYYHVHLFLVDGRSNELVLQECSGHAGASLKAQGLRIKIGDEGITGWVAQTGQPAVYNDVAQVADYYPHQLLPETQSELAIPLKIGDIVVGVLDVQSKQCNVFEEDDLTTLQILGDQVAIAIENANLFREIRRQFEVMRGLHRISLDITSQLESEEALTVILEQGAYLLNAQGSSLVVYDPEVDLARLIAVHNLPSKFQGMTLGVGEGAAGKVIATGTPVIANDYQNWSGSSPVFQESPYDAIVSVPLRWEGQVFGALSIMDHGKRRPFTDDDAQSLGLFADLASIALKNADLYAQVVQLNQQLEQKVEQRTNELVRAQEELAQKAEHLQRLLATTVRIQEEERTRIAQDLHDGSNQLITGTLYEIQAAQQSILGQREEAALEKLETAKGLLRTIDAENHRIIIGLRPPVLDAQGLVPALKWHADSYQEHSRVVCSIQVFGKPVRLSPEAETAIYRIVQESLNNVAEHAQAQCVQIQVNFEPAQLHIFIEDDGIGFDYESVLMAPPGRMGLIGMRERAQSIGGRVQVHSEPGGGTRIVLNVPLPAEPASEVIPELTLPFLFH